MQVKKVPESEERRLLFGRENVMQIYDLILYNDIFLSLLWVWFLAIVELFKCFGS